MAEYNPLPLLQIAEQFAKLPGIGMKSAQRLAYHVLNMPVEQVEDFANIMTAARGAVRFCKVCQNFTEDDMCKICADEQRDGRTICVVEAPRDVTAIERSGGYSGTYHVLHGLLSPINNIGPNELRIKELVTRLSGDVSEVIMATSPTIEGETTASYISRLVKPFNIKVTRLAYGLPVGASLEFADDVTLQRAIENRSDF